MSVDLFITFLERELGGALDDRTAVDHLSGWQVMSALWPLNDVFRPVVHQIRSLPYQAHYESAADDAIERFVFNGASWASQQAPVWRVLLERHQQALTLAAMKEHCGEPVMPLPSALPPAARQGAVMLFLLLRMKLPFPPADRSGLELPPGAAPGPLTRH